MIFTQSIEAELLAYEQVQQGDSLKVQGTIALQKISDGTQVTWKQVTPLANNPVALLRGAFRKYKAEKELQQSLHGLKNFVNSASKRRASK